MGGTRGNTNTELVCLGHYRGSLLIIGLTAVGRTDVEYHHSRPSSCYCVEYVRHISHH
jgi:hypothetical protein